MNFVVVVGNMDEGFQVYGPFATQAAANAWLNQSGDRAWYQTDILKMTWPTGLTGSWQPTVGDRPYVLLCGNLANGLRAVGPFNGLEHARENDSQIADSTRAMPLYPAD